MLRHSEVFWTSHWDFTKVGKKNTELPLWQEINKLILLDLNGILKYNSQ